MFSSNKMINVAVKSMEAEMEFTIRASTNGKLLFDQIVKTIGIREIWYFGLQYVDTKGMTAWLKLDKKILSQEMCQPPNFKFLVKFYPEDVAEIIQDITLRYFYLQVRDQILNNEIYCPAETAVLLASYAMQCKYGDYDPDQYLPGFLASDRLLPQRVSGQYKLSAEEWEKRIMVWWADHKGVTHENAMLEYLRIAQDLEMYGINYFEICNKKGTDLYLGVDALGLNIYERDDKINPKVGFPWSEIRNISFNDKRFVIKLIDKKASDFVFYAPLLRINKRILSLCMGNHELYMRRRKADSIEVQQMKLQAKEERMQRQLEQERLNREMNARGAAEQKQREYEARIQQMQAEMDRAHSELENAQNTIRQLNQQLMELNEAKSELAERERALAELNHQLHFERQMSEEERMSLIDEITLRKSQVAEMRTEIDTRTSETHKLQREVEKARTRQQQNQHLLKEHGGDDLTDVHVELTNDQEAIQEKDFDRMTATDQNVNIKKKLEMLNKELDKVKDEKALTNYDVLHMENKRAGRDKYKTLRQIRSGNTKRRIDQYENM